MIRNRQRACPIWKAVQKVAAFRRDILRVGVVRRALRATARLALTGTARHWRDEPTVWLTPAQHTIGLARKEAELEICFTDWGLTLQLAAWRALQVGLAAGLVEGR